jgi:hypothetical protein
MELSLQGSVACPRLGVLDPGQNGAFRMNWAVALQMFETPSSEEAVVCCFSEDLRRPGTRVLPMVLGYFEL